MTDNPAQTPTEAYRKIATFGGTRGHKTIPSTKITNDTSISTSTNRDWIGGLILDQEVYGTRGNQPEQSLVLSRHEYISYIRIAWHLGVLDYVCEITIETSGSREQRFVFGPGARGFPTDYGYVGKSRNPEKGHEQDAPARVLEISGLYDDNDFLGSLVISYLEPYIAVERATDPNDAVMAIISISPGGTMYKSVTTSKLRQLEATTAIQQFTANNESQISASYGVVEASTKFSFGYMSQSELVRETEKERTIQSIETTQVPDDKVGVFYCKASLGSIMGKQKPFLYAETEEMFWPFTIEELAQKEFYDLSGQAKDALGMNTTTNPTNGIPNYHAPETPSR